jgi:hypothetical protein
VPDHDAAPVGDLLGDVPVAGFFAAGELGPVASKNFLHGCTGSMVLLADADWVLRRRDGTVAWAEGAVGSLGECGRLC